MSKRLEVRSQKSEVGSRRESFAQIVTHLKERGTIPQTVDADEVAARCEEVAHA